MTKPLTQWRCDRCGGPVVAEEDAENGGYVNWDHNRAPIIVHKFRCQNDALRSSAPLSEFLGPDGLAYCTAMLSYGAMRAHHHRLTPADHYQFPDCTDAFVDFVRRVQLPYYEEARPAMFLPDQWEYWNDSSEVAPYLQKNLRKLAFGL